MRTRITETQRAIQRLKGVMIGIAIDGVVNEEEVKALSEWLEFHPHFHRKEPFAPVVRLLRDVLSDNHVDEDEKEEILELCWMFDEESSIPKIPTVAIRRLHGALQGISSDLHIREAEVIGLKHWLTAHKVFKEHWPFCDLWEMLSKILADGKVDENEKAELMDYCRSFAEEVIENPIIHDDIYDEDFMQTDSPALKPFSELCDREARIEFEDSTFCFTGPAVTGPRKDLHKIVRQLAGIPKKSIDLYLDYLVIGAQSSPCWAYSTYGRKIEKVLNNRKKVEHTIILHEDDFVKQVNSMRI